MSIIVYRIIEVLSPRMLDLPVVTNALDTMTYLAYKHLGLARSRVIGQAGILDSTRMAAFVAQELDVAIENVQSVMLGGHENEMVPLMR